MLFYRIQTINFLILMLLILFGSCRQETCKCPVTNEQTRMNDSIQSAFVNTEQYKNIWTRLNEPNFLASQTEAYRLIFTSILDERLFIYRIEKSGNIYLFHKKEFADVINTGAGERSDSLIYNFSRTLSQAEWDGLKNAFIDNCFWTMATKYNSERDVLDGGDFLLEGNLPEPNICTQQKYHLVETRVPDSIYYRIADSFIALEPNPKNQK